MATTYTVTVVKHTDGFGSRRVAECRINADGLEHEEGYLPSIRAVLTAAAGGFIDDSHRTD